MLNSKKRILSFFDIATLTFFSNFGVRWFAVAAGIGASSILFWLLGAALFFVPLAFITAQLSKLYPEEGGIYAWTRRSLGQNNGFMVAWLYWVNNLFYYPAVLIFLATNLAYFLGKPALANNGTFICITVLIFFWTIIGISLFGLRANKLMTEYGGLLGTIIPSVLLIVLGFGLFIWTGHSATVFNWHTITPDQHIFHNLSNLTLIMFAMAGVEIIPTFANSVENPKRDLYFGLIIGAAAMVIFYILGTVALNFILTPNEVANTSGLMDAFRLVGEKMHLPWFTRSVAFLLVFAELAVVSIWLIAPITMFFKCTPKGLLPNWCHTTNKHNAPVYAILFVAAIVTVIILVTNLLPSVNNRYQALVVMSAILYFIPYLFLAVAYIKNKHKVPGPLILKYFFAIAVFVSICLGIIFGFVPPAGSNLHNTIVYDSEMFFTTLAFILLGYAIYYGRRKYIS